MGTRAAWLPLVLACLLAGPARAQHGFVPPEDRPLHERLAEARIVTFATVARVDPGRIAFEAPAPVRGTVPETFEMKRAPSKAPPWDVGDRALLLLSGARSPYLWVERPAEAITLEDAAAEARWREALRALDPVIDDPVARRRLYAAWCDGEAEGLAAAGLRGLLDLSSLFTSVEEDFSIARARVAMDPGRSLAVRRRAARVAVKNPAGIALLLEDLTRGEPTAGPDPEMAEIVLQAALLARRPEFEAGLVWALDAPETEVGALGLRLAGMARTPAVERKLSELAIGHPDAEVRDDASHALQRLRRNNLPRGG